MSLVTSGAALTRVMSRRPGLVGGRSRRRDLSTADLYGAHFYQAIAGYTMFADVDLSAEKRLETVPVPRSVHNRHRHSLQIKR
jgi:hypothetical protein